MNITPASLVRVTAGRDKNNYLMIYKILDENYVLICDGKRRKIEAPKKKKLKHIESLNYSLGTIDKNLKIGKEISNSEIRKSIREALLALGILSKE